MKPRVHGNGFIQFPLTENLRLHVWPDHSIPVRRQKVYTGIHTHRFSYRSVVIQGKLIHREYAWKSAHLYEPVEVTHRLFNPGEAAGFEEMLFPTNEVGSLREVKEKVLEKGDGYSFPANAFHEIIPIAPLSVTLMEKTQVSNSRVYVACRMGEQPDNTFERDVEGEEELLWEIIVAALRGQPWRQSR